MSTGKDGESKIEDGTFKDGEVRFSVTRERGGEKFTSKYGKYFYDYSPEALDAMSRYGWPGNVRELENTVERAVVLSRDGSISVRNIAMIAPHTVPAAATNWSRCSAEPRPWGPTA